MRRWIAGALVLPVAAAVGAAVGYVVADCLDWVLFYPLFILDRYTGQPVLRWLRVALSNLFSAMRRYPLPYLTISSFLGAVGCIFLGVWLIRRLFGVRPARP